MNIKDYTVFCFLFREITFTTNESMFFITWFPNLKLLTLISCVSRKLTISSILVISVQTKNKQLHRWILCSGISAVLRWNTSCNLPSIFREYKWFERVFSVLYVYCFGGLTKLKCFMTNHRSKAQPYSNSYSCEKCFRVLR